VAATPTIHHKISWDQFYYTIYRFPYMVEINGAKPEGFQTEGVVERTATVDATAYVGPNARVLGNAQVRNNARIEGRAVVKGGTVSGNAVVKDYAMVAGGTITDRAIVSEGANIFNGQISGDAKIHGAANIVHSGVRISGNAQVGGVVLLDAATILSGTAQLLGDGEVYAINASSGVYYGLVDAGVIGDNQYGGNRMEPPMEVTKPRSMKWPDEPTNIFAVKPNVQFFKLSNSGVFSYNLGEASSANLKIFDGRGRLLKAMPLSGSQGVVNVQLGSARVLFWRVELPNGKVLIYR
jgi:carbonic anhydrase/acetyltransferase-like protein (isoleucine patch superfamily)